MAAVVNTSFTQMFCLCFSDDLAMETDRHVTVLLNSEESTLHIVNRPMDPKVT